MRILAAHLKPGDRISGHFETSGAELHDEELVEVRQDPDAVTVLTSRGRLVTIHAARVVDIADRDVLLG